MLAVVGASLGGIVLFKEVHHASQMPVVNVEFGDRPTIEFPSETAPAGLKVVELLEGNGPMVRRGDTVTVNYHGVVWGKDTPFDSSFDRHQPASFGIGVGQVIKVGTRPFRGTTSVPAWWYPFRRSMAMVPVAFRRPASAAKTPWCS